MSTETLTSTRKVKVVPTRGENKVIETSATEWGELEKELSNSGYEMNKLKAVEGRTRVTLENPHAVLPEGNFFVFLMPVESKLVAKAVKKAVPKKVAKKAVKKATPKKTAKKVAAKKTATKSSTKKVKAKATSSVPDFPSDEELKEQLKEVQNTTKGVKRY